MQLVVITPADAVKDEISTIESMLSLGDFMLHIRKPNWSIDQIGEFISQLPKETYSRLVIHQHELLANKFNLGGLHLRSDQPIIDDFNGRLSKSFHEVLDLHNQEYARLSYGFLSPVFDSISKSGYLGKYKSLDSLTSFDVSFNLIGLGGITPENIESVFDIGFKGAAVLGAVWQHESIAKRLNVVESLLQKCFLYA